MSSIAYRSTLTGVLNRVMVVVLLGCVGLTAGLAFGTLFSSNQSFSFSCRSGIGPQPWCSPTVTPTTSLGVTVVMPPRSSYKKPANFVSAEEMVRWHPRLHPGVREVAHGDRVIELSPTGFRPALCSSCSSDRRAVCAIARRHCDDYTAQWLALRRVVKWGLQGVGSRPYKVIWHGAPPVGFPRPATSGRLPMGGCVLFGLLAGLSAALGFLVPPRSRVTAVHSAST
ncbi:MAG TPA: hypothetical protein VF983_16275 [Streptosporangiaceae bacterium]